MSYHPAAGGPGAGTSGPPKVPRGSRKRVDRIKWQQHSPLDFWIFVLIVLVVLFLLIAGVRGW